ncbi:FAS1-like dehydratase domain-containing protein [Mameliella sediminis]|uniref:FAS1-like dehydratase domain-containing protein n=1 Tax=Mameliella sediminis TaxID=2836866 RepID=UPI001C47237A|nr:MaoC family dehydratase N-terminal domain-containing protein [Mameliella sediminis]MBV7395102.1 MaoC family dehydratase N-terminal domain-containing protein [Mameliella sediminis]
MQNGSEAVRRQTDVMDPDRAKALQAALDLPVTIDAGRPLPPFFHQIYFWDAQPPGVLGRDGHPRVGTGLIPDLNLPRRMWAGGALQFHAPLRAGQMAEKQSRVADVTIKQGRSGALGFVTLAHEIWQGGQLCVTERQDLVYREDPDPSAPRPQAPVARDDAARQREMGFSSTLLFRYSALTFNGHRIHYDIDYAREVEGYGGLVVHGPLLAQGLLLFAEEQAPVRSFSFRATAPLMHDEPATLCVKETDMWVRGPDGRQCMQAAVEF